jgi:DNA mismatch repair ATPase MutS
MTLTVCQFEDDNFLTLTESCLVQLGVRELIFINDQHQSLTQTLRSIGQALNCVVTPVKSSEFDERSGEQSMLKMCRNQSECMKWIDHCTEPVVLKGVAALCSYLNLLRYDSAYHSYRLAEHLMSQFMRLDETAFRSLDLFPRASGMPMWQEPATT